MKLLARIKALFPTRQEVRQQRKAFSLCALSGILGAFLFPNYGWGWLAWVALVPYFHALFHLRGKSLAWGTLLFGFLWYYTELWWLNTLTIFNPFVPVGIVLIGLIYGAVFLLFAFPASFAFRRLPRWFSPFVVASLWVGVEFMRSKTAFAFPWNYLGHSQVPNFIDLIQIADVYGVYGVSFVIALTNALLVLGRPRRKLELLPAVTWALMMAGVLSYGITSTSRWSKQSQLAFDADASTSQTLRLAILQPNVSQIEKLESYAPETTDSLRQQLQSKMVRQLFDMMQQAAPKYHPQLFVLPETAFTTPWFVYETFLQNDLKEMATRLNADIFFGADGREPYSQYQYNLKHHDRASSQTIVHTLPKLLWKEENGSSTPYEQEERMAIFNSAWLVKPGQGLSTSVYSKMQLVPFGESAPYVDKLPFFDYFQQNIMMVGTFQNGVESTIFETAGVRYGALICFESSFATLARSLARNGAQMICVLTNDAWYDPKYLSDAKGFWGALVNLPYLKTLADSGPEQHFTESIFRAVETRLPVVRAANTGISAVITSTGNPLVRSRFGEETTLAATVPVPRHAPTFYVIYGDWFAELCLVLWLIMASWQVLDTRSQKPRRAAHEIVFAANDPPDPAQARL